MGILLGRALELSGEELDEFLSEILCFRVLEPEAYVSEVLPHLFREYLCGISREKVLADYDRIVLTHLEQAKGPAAHQPAIPAAPV